MMALCDIAIRDAPEAADHQHQAYEVHLMLVAVSGLATSGFKEACQI